MDGKVGKLHDVEAWVSASSFVRWCLASAAPSAKNEVLKMLPEGGIKSSGKQFCEIFCRVKVCNVGRFLHEHDESDRVSGLKMPVGPRWREFQCFAASRGVL